MNKKDSKIIIILALIILLMIGLSVLASKIAEKGAENRKATQIVFLDVTDEEKIQVANVVINYIDTINNKKEIVNDVIAKECTEKDNELSFWECTEIKTFKEAGNIKLYHVRYTYNDVQKKLVIKLDRDSKAYCIYTDDYINQNDLENIPMTEVKKNDNNEFAYIEDNTYNRILLYMQNYLIIAEADLSGSVRLIDEEYYSTFSSKDEYKQVVTSIKEAITSEPISEFSKDNGEIIFKIGSKADIKIKEKDFMNYRLVLDSYRIQKKEYSNLPNDKKAEKIANDFVEMVKIGDYESLYNVLNGKFKSNNYDSIESLRDKLTNEIGSIEYYSIRKIGNTVSKQYQFQITTNNREVGNKTIDLIIKLIDNEKYEISFSIKE